METITLLTLLELPKIGRKTVKKFSDELNFKSLNLDHDETLEFFFEVKPNLRLSVSNYEIEKAQLNAKKIIEDCRKLRLELIPIYHRNYPIPYYDLKDDAPVLLYVKGDLSSLANQRNIAIIGTRNNSNIAEKVGELITKEFVYNNFQIVSGLAKGCDTIAHKSCLKYNGITIAILANGLNTIYPAENKELAAQIIEKGGCIVSEYPPYGRTMPSYFVERDRLQSGLSKGVVVIETDTKGGSLHTVQHALNQNRKVACVKYKENYQFDSIRGNRQLISDGTAFGITQDNISEFIQLLEEKDPFKPFPKNKSQVEMMKLPSNETKDFEINFVEIAEDDREVGKPKDEKSIMETINPTEISDGGEINASLLLELKDNQAEQKELNKKLKSLKKRQKELEIALGIESKSDKKKQSDAEIKFEEL